MAISFGRSGAARRAIDALSRIESDLGSVWQRLSSGRRIVRASDDAAGLAIASRLSSEAGIYTQSIRNLNDGISALQIADSGVESLSALLQRQLEIAQQAATGTLTTAQRTSLDRGFQQLRAEYQRTLESTLFNGISLFSDQAATLSLQAAANPLALSIRQRRMTASIQLSDAGTYTSADVEAAALSGSFDDDPYAPDPAVFRGNGNIIFVYGIRKEGGSGSNDVGGFVTSYSVGSDGTLTEIDSIFVSDGPGSIQEFDALTMNYSVTGNRIYFNIEDEQLNTTERYVDVDLSTGQITGNGVAAYVWNSVTSQIDYDFTGDASRASHRMPLCS